jgi:hypothetical protein
LITVLETAFGDPDCVATAEWKLEALKQTKSEFFPYYVEFQRYTTNVLWNHPAKCTALMRGLNNEIKDALILSDNILQQFLEFVAFLQQLDNWIRAQEAEKKGKPAPQNTNTTPWAPPTTHIPLTATGTHPGHMDFSPNWRILTPEECQKKILERRYLYCGGFGYVV